MVKLQDLSRGRVSVCILSSVALLVAGAIVLYLPDGHDHAVVSILNSYTRRSFLFDAGCHAFAEEPVFSGMIFVAILWFCWFSSPDVQSRRMNLSGTIASALAGMFSRMAQLLFPSRPRPFQDASLHLKLPFTVEVDSLRHVASSFPSDHAALYFALAATIYSLNHKCGYYAFGLAILVDLVRLYLGFHYVTDIIGGAALGVLCVCVGQQLRLTLLEKRVSAICQTPSATFYAVAFCISYGIATMFYDVRLIASHLAHSIRH